MNLFAIEDSEVLRPLGFDNSWIEALTPTLNFKALEETLKFVEDDRKNYIIYPNPSDIFKVFSYPFDKVKVLIIGQDPYFNGNADGLAFSCATSVSPSLSMISQAMQNDLKKGLPRSKNLEYLAEQGVMLLNTALTVRKDKPFSHSTIGWDTFIDTVLNTLKNGKQDLAVLAWGEPAKNKLKEVKKEGFLCLTNEHPVAAHRNNRSWSCDHFSKVNEYLKSKGKEEIQWL